MRGVQTLGRVVFAVPFAVFGLLHLMSGPTMAGMVPVPGGAFWIYFTGVCLLAGSLGILTRVLGSWAALGLALLLAVFILFVHIPGLSDPAMKQAAMPGLLKDLSLSADVFLASFSRPRRRGKSASMHRALLAVLALSSSCASTAPVPSSEPGVDVVLVGETMGSTWHARVHVASSREGDARALQPAVDALLERINDEMSTYRPNSEISRFNAHQSAEPFPVSSELALVVEKALEIGRDTEGAYDITIDPLINLWGFDRAGRRDSPPSPEEIAAAKAHTGLSLVRVEGGALVKADPLVTINLGGIAAGYAADAVGELLDDAGFHDWMVEITGEVRAKGKSSKGAPWKIGVQFPDAASDDVVQAVPLVDAALTTSGSYQNFFEKDGKRYSHILDPRTSAPVDTPLVSVTVLAPDALTADGYDTAFLILGEERARRIIARHPGMAALFIAVGTNGVPTTTTTASFPAAE